MKMYVLMEYIDYEGASILSVHSSEESAKKVLAEIVEEDKKQPSPFSYGLKLSRNSKSARSECCGMSITIDEHEVVE